MEPETMVVSALSAEDERLVDALRARDEVAFTALVEEYGRAMLGLARLFVRNRSVAEEVVQEAWLGVLRGIDRFEGRSSLKTWIFRILTNTAKTRAEREGRTMPFSSLASEERGVDPDCFLAEGRWAGHWVTPPSPWEQPEDRLLGREARADRPGDHEAAWAAGGRAHDARPDRPRFDRGL
jgi:RNA polymerase sigma-70 factor (ECF subfamily)